PPTTDRTMPTIEGHFLVFFLNTAITDTTSAASSTTRPMMKTTTTGMHARIVPTTARPRPMNPRVGVDRGSEAAEATGAAGAAATAAPVPPAVSPPCTGA